MNKARDCALNGQEPGTGGRPPAGRIHYHNEVMACGNGKRVARMVNGGAQAANSRVAKIVRVEHRRIVRLVVGDAFDVTGPAECRVDCYGVAIRRAARIGESEGLVVV